MWPHYVLSVGFPDVPNVSPKFWKIDVLSDCPALYLYIYIVLWENPQTCGNDKFIEDIPDYMP